MTRERMRLWHVLCVFFLVRLTSIIDLKIWQRWCLVLLIGLVVAAPSDVRAACLVEKPPGGNAADLLIHLSKDCTATERDAHAVRGDAIITAIANGHRVELVGVVIRGDLLFERLPISAPPTGKDGVPGSSSPSQPVGEGDVRIVRETLAIRDSVVLGSVNHRSDTEALRFERLVDFQGTRFKGEVDLSRSVFNESVDLSGAMFEKPAFWVKGLFNRGIGCRETKFGPSTRFHRAIVRGPLECTGALFDGMAEFLEVTFEGSAVFERARFGLGTGFSGSRFHDRVNFGEAIFSRETFFAFTQFEREAVFAGAQFLGPADCDSKIGKP